MMGAACETENCTVGETGVCLRNNDPSTCPHRKSGGVAAKSIVGEIAPLARPAENPRFPFSFALTSDQVDELMASRYCSVIGILGAPNAGKTSALVSLYLLLGRAMLEGFHFADSRSLMAFDEISQGARRWNKGNLPEQLTTHTEAGRTAGFLHLRLRRENGNISDLLLPDLPGEWTDKLIDINRTDRWNFLKRADLLWVMLDGHELAQKRKETVHRTRLLLQRVAAFIRPVPPLIIVVTRRDSGPADVGALDRIKREAGELEINLKVVEIASFSDNDGTLKPGTGIKELIEATVARPTNKADLWPVDDTDVKSEPRAMMHYRWRQ